MLIAELPDPTGRGEQRVLVGWLAPAARMFRQRVPQGADADPVGLQHLGQRHPLVRPAAADLLRCGEVQGVVRVSDGMDDDMEVARD